MTTDVNTSTPISTKERLARALESAKAPAEMITEARAGRYDDYESGSATPISDLIRHAIHFGLSGIAAMAMDGQFDGTAEEAEAWFAREGEGELLRLGTEEGEQS